MLLPRFLSRAQNIAMDADTAVCGCVAVMRDSYCSFCNLVEAHSEHLDGQLVPFLANKSGRGHFL